MKVKTKVGVFFSVLITATLLLNIVFYVVLAMIQNTVKEKTAIEHQIENLSMRYIDHLIWVQSLNQQITVDIKKEISLQTDPSKCAFGQWYSTDEWKTLFPKGSMLEKLLAELDTPHKALHGSAAQILQKQKQQEYETVNTIFINNTIPELEKLKVIFTSINSEGKKLSMEKEKEMIAIENRSRVISTMIGGGVIVILIIVFVVIIAIIAVFKDIVFVTDSLAQGNFAVKVPEKKLKEKNEVGELFRSTSKMIKSVSSMLGTIQRASFKLSEHSSLLTENAEETHRQVERIADESRTANKETSTQIVAVKTVTTSVEQIITSIKNLDFSIEDQSAAVSESSAGIEEMIGNIASINTNIAKVSGMFNELIAASEEGKVKQKSVEQEVNAIVSLSESLNETNKLIASISSQTNLLAMNAAIESAHAGEAGQGFAVVADEIRKLAEKSSIQTKEIAKQLKEIRNGINSIVVSASETRQSFDTIAKHIDQTNNLVEQVNFAISEQSAGSQQILEGIRKINTITDDVRTGSKQMFKSSNEILGEIKELTVVSQSVSSSMEMIDRETDEITEATSSVLNIASETKKLIEDVAGETSQFKID